LSKPSERISERERMRDASRAAADALLAVFVSPNVADRNGEDANIVDALAMIAQQLNYLGNADAATSMGALEAHGKAMMDSADRIASALEDVADAIREST
jgi:hypothetical protein